MECALGFSLSFYEAIVDDNQTLLQEKQTGITQGHCSGKSNLIWVKQFPFMMALLAFKIYYIINLISFICYFLIKMANNILS